MNEINEIRLMLADVLEAIAATDRRVAGLSISLVAMREALKEVSPREFEHAYANRYSELEQQGLGRSPLETGETLLALAKKLRKQT